MRQIIQVVASRGNADVLPLPDVVAWHGEFIFEILYRTIQALALVPLSLRCLHDEVVDCLIAPGFTTREVKLTDPKHIDQSGQESTAYSHQVVDSVCVVREPVDLLIQCVNAVLRVPCFILNPIQTLLDTLSR